MSSDGRFPKIEYKYLYIQSPRRFEKICRLQTVSGYLLTTGSKICSIRLKMLGSLRKIFTSVSISLSSIRRIAKNRSKSKQTAETLNF